MEHRTDSDQLLRRAHEGDRAAFDVLVSKVQGRLTTLVRLRMGSLLKEKVTIEDVLQEALLRAFQSVERATFDTERSFFAWLATITERTLVDLARRHAARPAHALEREIPGGTVSPSRGLQREERFERLQRALDGLSPDHREVIILARLQRLPLKEIARRMDRSYSAVANLLSRALAELRSSFGDTESLHLPFRSLKSTGAGDD
jgi:RNA polymerase sigma-70 factor (ECF subfamily)